jgi:hypothetical protein
MNEVAAVPGHYRESLGLPSPAAIPLRIPERWFWPIGIGLGLLGVALIATSPFFGYLDFPQFWSVGRTVGTIDLLDPIRHMDWQTAHGVSPGYFVYPAGAAWLFVPFALSTIEVGFWLHAATMTALVAVAGLLGARIYGLDRRVGVVAAFAWMPCIDSAIVGQNAALGLVFALIAIEGLRRDSDVLAGLGVGLLLYKPTLAAPLIALLLLRRRWGASLIVVAGAAGWYLAGTVAAAGDWSWPGQWLAVLGDYYRVDTAANVIRAISLPGLLAGHGVPTAVAWAVGAVLAMVAVPRLIKSPMAEAGAGALLVGVVVSPHALNYEGALILPVLLWALGATRSGISEPARTRLIAAAYLIAPEYLISQTVGLSSLGLLATVAVVIWTAGLWRFEKRSRPPANTQLLAEAATG